MGKGKEVLGGHGSRGDYPNQTRANRVEDIPFARALGSAQRGEEVHSEQGVIDGTQKRDRWYGKPVIDGTETCNRWYTCTPRTRMNATSTVGSQYPIPN